MDIAVARYIIQGGHQVEPHRDMELAKRTVAEWDEQIRMLKDLHNLLDDGGNPMVRFASTGECAEWIYNNRAEILDVLK